MNFISLIAFAFALNLFAFAFARIRFFVHRELLFGYVGHPESDIVPRVWRCGLLLDLVEISKGRYNFPRMGPLRSFAPPFSLWARKASIFGKQRHNLQRDAR